jgi:AraC-like DNA-binding protein/quercetin dioxygenase-like cupin family protein
MKAFVQKLPLSEDTSFVCRMYRTPNFEVPWHSHIEYELILFTEGEGTSFIGNYIGNFKKGDIFFLAKNLPHTFQNPSSTQICSAIVLQFREDLWGSEMIQLPETRDIMRLFNTSVRGLKVTGKSKKQVKALLEKIEVTSDFKRILYLLQCLDILSTAKEYQTLSTESADHYHEMSNEKIDKVFEFTIASFKDTIKLENVAQLIGMSVLAFCNYFKKHAHKTYVNFLNEIRIGYACKLLSDSDKTITEICFESGFNSIANFNKQFTKIKQIAPSQFRKKFFQSKMAL